VIEASTGTDALALAARKQPDLAVLDVNLPDISGLEVCRRLRAANPTLPGIQILQISNTAITPADQVRGLQHGADVYSPNRLSRASSSPRFKPSFGCAKPKQRSPTRSPVNATPGRLRNRPAAERRVHRDLVARTQDTA
jgi:CheY-like chemotaxis protein